MALQIRQLAIPDYEKVVYAEEPTTGLRAWISIHNTKLGPACGGIRLLSYRSDAEALEDVLRLSKGMSYKSSLAGLDFGGGKSVINLPAEKKTNELLHAFGDFVETFKGRYISAKDMNISSPDLLEVKKRTRHVLGIEGVAGSGGDPSPLTAFGVLRALEATAQECFGKTKFSDLTVAIQGLGYVGYRLAELLHEKGVQLIVTDIDEAATNRAKKDLGATVVPPDTILSVECDILSPCARGAILNDKTIAQLKCKAVCGAANNQLADAQDGFRLHERGILYAPDFAVNAGGIINVFAEYEGYDEQKAYRRADNIFNTLERVYARSRQKKAPPFIVANELAEERWS